MQTIDNLVLSNYLDMDGKCKLLDKLIDTAPPRIYERVLSKISKELEEYWLTKWQ